MNDGEIGASASTVRCGAYHSQLVVSIKGLSPCPSVDGLSERSEKVEAKDPPAEHKWNGYKNVERL